MFKVLTTIVNVLIVFFLLVSFYSSIGEVFNVSSESRLITFIVLIVSLFVICLLGFGWGKNNLTRLSMVVFVWLIYVLFNVVVTIDNSLYSLLALLRISIWWVVVFFYGNILGQNNNIKQIRWLFIASLPLLIYMLIFTVTFNERLFDRHMQINYVFYILVLLPIFMTIQNNRVRSILLLVVVATCFYSMKRSAIIIAILCLIVYLFEYFRQSRKNAILKTLSLIALLLISIQIFQYMNERVEGGITQRFESISDDRGSGRLDIYEHVWYKYQQLSLPEQVFGCGYNTIATKNIIGGHLSAHNDFLEVLYDYGLWGLIIYLFLWYHILKRYFLLRLSSSSLSMAYFMSIVIFVVLSLVSHLIIYPTYFICLTFFWGYVEGVCGKRPKIMSC